MPHCRACCCGAALRPGWPQEKQPTGRTSLPEEIARTLVWLCDPAAHNLTGAAIPIDGGWTAQ